MVDVDEVHRGRWRFRFERATSQPPVLQQHFMDKGVDFDDLIRIRRKEKCGRSKEKVETGHRRRGREDIDSRMKKSGIDGMTRRLRPLDSNDGTRGDVNGKGVWSPEGSAGPFSTNERKSSSPPREM